MSYIPNTLFIISFMEIRKDAFEIMLQMVVRLSESFTKAY